MFAKRMKELEVEVTQLERKLDVRDTNNNILRLKNNSLSKELSEKQMHLVYEKKANKALCELNHQLLRKLDKEEQENKLRKCIITDLEKVNDDLIKRLRDVTAYKSQVETLKGEVDKKDRFAQELKKYAENLIERIERNQNIINTKNETIEHLQTRLNRKADNALLQEAQSRKVAEQEERIKELETQLFLSERREKWANNDIEKWKNKFEEKRTEAFNSYQDNKKLQAKIERQDTIINVLAK